MKEKDFIDKNSHVFTHLPNSIKVQREAERLIHNLAMEASIKELLESLVMEIESLEVEEIPDIFNAVYEQAIKGNPQAEKVLMAFMCATDLEQLILNNRYQLIWEGVLEKNYLDLWMFYTNIQNMFRRSSAILAELVPLLMNLSRSFAETLREKRPIFSITQLLSAFYKTCEEKGLSEIRTLKLHPKHLAELLYQEKSEELISSYYNELVNLLEENNFVRQEDGTYHLDILSEILIPLKKLNRAEKSIYDQEKYHHDVLTDTAGEEAREKIKHLLLGEKISLAKKGDRKWLQFLIYDRNPLVIEQVLKNSHVYQREVALMANRRSTPPKILKKIYENERWKKLYPIKLGLVKNPNTPHEIAYDIIPSLIQKDILDVMKLPELDKKVRRRAEAELKRKIRNLSVGSRIALAKGTRNRGILDILIADLSGNVVKAALHNPMISVETVLNLAQNPHVSPIALWTIAQNTEWVENVSIKIALLENPNTPESAIKHVQTIKAKGEPVQLTELSEAENGQKRIDVE